MAWLERRGGKFRLSYRYGGRKFQHAVKTDDEREAKALLMRLEANLRDLENGRLVAPDGGDLTLFLLSDGKASRRADAAERLTVGRLLEKHREAAATGLEKNTLATHEIHSRHLTTSLGKGVAAEGVSAADLQRHVDRRSRMTGRRGSPVSAVTIRKELQTLSAAWNWGVRTGLVKGDLPLKGLVYPKKSQKPPFMTRTEILRRAAGLPAGQAEELWDALFLTKDEVGALLGHVEEHARHHWIHPAVCFAAHTGARRSEILRARVGDFDLVGGDVLIQERKRDKSTRTSRRVPLTPGLAEVMTAWLGRHPGGPLAFCQEDGSPLTVPMSNHHFEQTLARSEWSVVRGWHVLRHSFASNCAAAGVDQRLIDAWMGHQNAETAARYRHLIPAVAAAAISRVF